jgi:multidrug resistance efflux pump
MKLDISHEPASMERHNWVRVPIIVDLNGQPHAAPEWGMAGVVLEPFQGEPPGIGASVALHMALPYKGFGISFDVPGVIETWDEAARRLVVGFRGLRARERELMTHFIAQETAAQETGTRDTGEATGQATGTRSYSNEVSPFGSIDSLMQRLSLVGTTAVDTRPAGQNSASGLANAATVNYQSETESSVAAGWWQRRIKNTAIGSGYGLLGLAVAGYLGYASYRHLAWLDVSGATLAAPVESILSMGDGAVRWTTFKPGDAVKAGDVLLNIFDNQLEREIEQAAIVVRERENKVQFLKRRLEFERIRMVGLGQVSSQKSLQITAEIEGMRQKLRSANNERRQLSSATPGPLAQVRQRIVGLQQAMALKELELKGRAALSDKTDGRMALVGQQLVGDSGTLEAQLEMDEAEVQLAEERHRAFLDQRNRLAVRAPFDGTLRQLTRYDTANIKRGDVAAVIEQGGDRGVRAVLRQDQALRLAVGAKAEVRVPATGQTFAAMVAEIEPLAWATGGGRDSEPGKTATASARHHADESQLVVRLAFADPRLLDNRSAYRAGLPVVALIQTGTPSAAPRAALASASVGWEQAMVKAAAVRTTMAPHLESGGRRWREFSDRAAESVVAGSRVWRAQFVAQYSAWKQRREEAALEAAKSTKSAERRG